MGPILFLLLLVAIVYAFLFWLKIWLRGLVSVMATEDHQFPARHDKILWVILFLMAPLLAPFAYTACVERFNRKQS